MNHAVKVVALLLASSGTTVVHAETIALAPIDCGIVKQCVNVPNDIAADVDLYLAPQYSSMNVYIGGVRYYSPVGNGASIANVSLTAVDGSGAMITMSGEFGTYKTCTHSGRGQTCSIHWNLKSGSIQK